MMDQHITLIDMGILLITNIFNLTGILIPVMKTYKCNPKLYKELSEKGDNEC